MVSDPPNTVDSKERGSRPRTLELQSHGRLTDHCRVEGGSPVGEPGRKGPPSGGTGQDISESRVRVPEGGVLEGGGFSGVGYGSGVPQS